MPGKIKADSIDRTAGIVAKYVVGLRPRDGTYSWAHRRSPRVERRPELQQYGTQDDLARTDFRYLSSKYKSNLFYISFLKIALLLYLSL